MKQVSSFFVCMLCVLNVSCQIAYTPIKTRTKWYTLPSFKRMSMPRDVAPTSTDKIYLDFVGSGDIQKAVSSGKDLNANTGAGVIFERYRDTKGWFQSMEIEASISIASTSDTTIGKYSTQASGNVLLNQRDFGLYLLNPVNGRQAFYQNTLVYFGYPEHFTTFTNIISGFNIRYAASNNVWQYNLTGNSSDLSSVNVGAYLFRFGLFHEFIPDNYRIDKETSRSKYSLFLGFNYSMRGLLGDIGNDKNADLRKHFFGNNHTGYHGFELNMGFRLSNLRLEFCMPTLSQNRQVPGLTSGQFLFTIRFVGGFGLEINTGKAAAEVAAAKS